MAGNAASWRPPATTASSSIAPRPSDRAKAELDARFDGVFVLRTNTDLPPLDAMLCYKQLTMVEQAFRTAKRLSVDGSTLPEPLTEPMHTRRERSAA